MLGVALVVVYGTLFLLGLYAMFKDIEEGRREYLSSKN